MSASGAQRYARQQLSHAKLLIELLEVQQSKPQQRALIQASVLTLSNGIEFYLNTIFEREVPISLLSWGGMSSESFQAPLNHQQAESMVLLTQPLSWLGRLIRILGSLPTGQKSHSESSTNRIRSDIALIASSEEVAHWTALDQRELSKLCDDYEAFVSRQTELDLEY